MLCFCHYDPALLRFWFQTNLGRENSASYLEIKARKTFSCQGHAWSRSTSNFYALIGQNLTGEFMRKIYAASWILFTLTAEADRVLSQLVMFLTVFFYWMYKNEIQLLSRVFCYSWLICLLVFFGWEKRRLSKSEIRIWMASFSFFTLLEKSEAILALLDTFQELHLEW